MCDAAFELLLGMPEVAGVSLAVVDIATPGAVSLQDFDALGPRLPVLAIGAPNSASALQTLDWPFTGQQVVALLGRLPVG